MTPKVSTISVSSDLLSFVNVPESEHAQHRRGIRNIRWIMAVRRIRGDVHGKSLADAPRIRIPARRKAEPIIRLGLNRMTRPVSKPVVRPAAAKQQGEPQLQSR